jgi:hypothetical protein
MAAIGPSWLDAKSSKPEQCGWRDGAGNNTVRNVATTTHTT